MNVSHVTGHIALHEVPDRLTVDLIYDTVRLPAMCLSAWGNQTPELQYAV